MLITILILGVLVLLLAVAEALTLIDDLTARRDARFLRRWISDHPGGPVGIVQRPDATTEELHRQYVAALRAHGIRGVR